MESRLIQADSSIWRRCLEHVDHDFYHLPEYVSLCAEEDGGTPAAFVAEQGECSLLVPLVVRRIPNAPSKVGDVYDAASPYGYPSPILAPHCEPERNSSFLRNALRMLVVQLRKKNVISIFVRTHPLLPLTLEPFEEHGTVVRHGETVYMDLTQPEEELWKQTRRSHRRRIRAARRRGYTVELDDDWRCFDQFFEIYTKTMRKVGAPDCYFFARQYFLRLKDILQEALHLCVVRIDRKVAAAFLYTEYRGIVQAHLGGSLPGHDDYSPTVLADDFVRRWAKQRGNRFFHLGGGRGGRNDSLFHFKAGLSKERSDFYTWRAVTKEDVYELLVKAWEEDAGRPADAPTGYFPAYRKPKSS